MTRKCFTVCPSSATLHVTSLLHVCFGCEKTRVCKVVLHLHQNLRTMLLGVATSVPKVARNVARNDTSCVRALRTFAVIGCTHPYCARNSHYNVTPRHALNARDE